MDHELDELQRESRMGGLGRTGSREVRCIDLADFESDREAVTEALWTAAHDVGFFQLANHGIDLAAVRGAFAQSERFFALPEHTKAQWPLERSLNAGWESRSQYRPSTGRPDEKESYQITLPAMAGRWPSEAELPGFRAAMEAFEASCWEVAMKVLSCFADRLGFEREFFRSAHDPQGPGYQSTLRILRYPAPVAGAVPGWRAGAHTDFDCLTLLFQQAGQSGLQVCPGAERESETWTPIGADEELITCNIGDMLMRWSDDQLQSTLHRVASPGPDDPKRDRYSIAFFAQANHDVLIESPAGRYAPITAADYLAQRVAANYQS